MTHVSKLIQIQLNQMFHRKGFKIGFAITLAYVLITNLFYVSIYMGWDRAMMMGFDGVFAGNYYSYFCYYFQLIFPVLIALPFSASYITDQKTKILPVLKTKSTVKNYLISKYIVCFMGAFLMIFIPFLISILINSLGFPLHSVRDINNNSPFSIVQFTSMDLLTPTHLSNRILFPQIYYFSPLLYNLLFAFIFSFFAGLASGFAYSVTLFWNKYKINSIVPFVILSFVSFKLGEFSTNNQLPALDYYVYLAASSHLDKKFYILILYCVVLFLISLILILKKSRSDQLD